MKDFVSKHSWIASTLGISYAEAKSAVSRLERLGLIKKDQSGKWKNLSNGLTTTNNPFTTSAFRKLQRQVLERALIKLEEIPLSHRDQSSMTMAIDTRKIPEAKNLIKEFRRKLLRVLGDGKSLDEVYHLSVSLYPISNIDRKRK